MKICYIADATSVHITEWLQFFLQRGHEIVLITDTENKIEGVEVINIGDCLPRFRIPLLSASYQIRKKVRKIRELLLKIQPDILHAHYATNYGYLAAKTGWHPYILTCHGSDILVDLYKSRLQHHFVKTALRRADLVSMPSEQMEIVVKECGIPREKILRIQYGIDIEDFRFPEKPKATVAVLSTRTLTYKYRIDVLVEAARIALDKSHDLRFRILGDGEDKEQFEQLAFDKYALEDKIHFHGKIAHENINRHFEESHIYVSTSPSDGISISLLEAFATGCYPIVPDIPANRHLRKSGFHLELFTVNDPKSLGETILRIQESLPMLQTELRENCDMVARLFSRKKNLERFNEIYAQYKR